jgi:hypothetical protein
MNDWATSTLTVAAVLALALASVLLVALLRRRSSRDRLTLDLTMQVTHADAGLRLLDGYASRNERWWVDADPADREEIDRALGLWDVVAWYVSTERANRETFFELYRLRLTDLWETAFLYIDHRRATQPGIWSALEELYDEACGTSGRRARQSAERFPMAGPQRSRPPALSVTPDEIPDPFPDGALELRRQARPRPEPVAQPAVAAASGPEADPAPEVVVLPDVVPTDATPAAAAPTDAPTVAAVPADAAPAAAAHADAAPASPAPDVIVLPDADEPPLRLRTLRQALQQVDLEIERPAPVGSPEAPRLVEHVVDMSDGRPFD